MDNLRQAVEAVLFTSDEPTTLRRLQELFPEAGGPQIREALGQLQQDYDQSARSFSLQEIAGGYQLLTRPQYAEVVGRLKKSRADRKLSPAALETLAIIAYKQPIRRVDVESVRGVASGEVIRALMERHLVRIAGRDDAPGAPLMYGTTQEFLDAFGLKTIEDLPRPEEVK